MKRNFLFFIFAAAVILGCKKSEPAPAVAAPTPSQVAIVPAPVGSPAAAVAGSVPAAMKNPGPAIPGQKGKDGKVAEQPLPPAIWDRMTKPLSDEDIKKLPPETRDMILRAQGKLPPAPSPKK